MDSSFSEYDEDHNTIPIWHEPRKEPLGAPKETLCEEMVMETISSERLHAMEEEQEILTSSVFSLSSHLAQVEFRLKQILKAPMDEKDVMLKALEEFTSKGVSDVRTAPQGSTDDGMCQECITLERKISIQREKQVLFIEKLKQQLKELERFAASPSYETGTNILQHQNLLEDLKKEIDRGIEQGYHQPVKDDLQHQIDCAIKQYAESKLSKEEIIGKLQKHIEETQRFIKLMKTDAVKESMVSNKKGKIKQIRDGSSSSNNKGKSSDELRTETINLMRKASTLIQIFTVSQFGCSPNIQQRHEGKKSTIVTHWGNLRAKLEMSIDAVLSLVSRNRSSQTIVDTYDSEEEGSIIINDTPLTTAVRRHLSVNLQKLLHHGLTGTEATSLVPMIGCFPIRKPYSTEVHFWDIIMRYYEMNDGDAFNSTPARKLSQSFNLDIIGETTISNKHSLLSTIGSIIASHSPYKRSYDAHFKAFVCSGLNAQKLVIWLNIILKTRSLIDVYYSSTSYVVNTGFQDALQSLDRLTPHKFDLPIDLAVKQFQNIKDVFM